MQKLTKLKFNYKIWLELPNNENLLGDGKYKLLKAIKETGSLKSAMEKLNLSYRKTWDNLKKIEKKLGFPLINPQRGGSDGGNTALTEEGEKILLIFEEFHALHDQLFAETAKKAFDKILLKK